MIVSVLVLINVNFTKGFMRFLHKLENKKSRNTGIVTKKKWVSLSKVLVVSMP